jgi:hypothetical protein
MAQGTMRKRGKVEGGYRTATYRDAKGRSYLAKVVSAGTGSTVNLLIVDRDRRTKGNQSLSNIALATSMKGTNVFFNILS